VNIPSNVRPNENVQKFSGQILSFLGPKKMGKKQGIIFLLQIQFGRGVWGERERENNNNNNNK
jgi:hypothetical protein